MWFSPVLLNHPSVGRCLCCFHFFGCEFYCREHLCTCFCADVFSVLLGVYLGMELLLTTRLSSKLLHPILFPPVMSEDVSVAISWSTHVVIYLMIPILAVLVCVKYQLIVALICISLMAVTLSVLLCAYSLASILVTSSYKLMIATHVLTCVVFVLSPEAGNSLETCLLAIQGRRKEKTSVFGEICWKKVWTESRDTWEEGFNSAVDPRKKSHGDGIDFW